MLGLDPEADGPEIRGRIGVCPQEDNLDSELSVRDNLVVYARYFGIPRTVAASRADELLTFVQLTEKANVLVDELSGGMKRRLTIARSLINRPEILLLDEPTTGLDPQARHLLWERLFRLKQQGVTLVLTTHYMDEAEQLCDRLVVMDGGLIVAEGSPRDLIARHSTREVAELRFASRGARGSRRAGPRPGRAGRDPARPAAALHRRRGRDPRRRARAWAGAVHGPRAALHAGGRLPPPHGPDAGGLMSAQLSPDRRQSGTLARLAFRWDLAWRQSDYWAITFRRTWRGSAFSSFIAPILYVAAMGVLLGGFITAGPSTLEGATSYLDFIAPGLVAVHAFQTGSGEVLWPLMGMFKWNKTHFAMIATPLSPLDLVNAHLAAIAARLGVVCGIFLGVLGFFGVYHSVLGGILALPAAVLTGLAVAAPLYAYTASLTSEAGLPLAFRLVVMPMVLFSGAFFPVANLPGALQVVAKVSPLWHGVDLVRMLMLGTVAPGMALLHVAYLVVLTLVGWWLAARRLTSRLVS